MKRGLRVVVWVIYATLMLAALTKATDIVEGFFLSPGFLQVWVIMPLGVIALPYLLARGIWCIVSKKKFWGTSTALAVLMLVWAFPIVGGWVARLEGYYLRVALTCDTKSIVAWADSYKPPDGSATSDHRAHVPRQDMPPALAGMGDVAWFDTNDRTVSISNGGALVGHWGLTVGRGASLRLGKDDGTRWAVNQDAYVWDAGS